MKMALALLLTIGMSVSVVAADKPYRPDQIVAVYPRNHWWRKHKFKLDPSHTVASVDACRVHVQRTIHDNKIGYCVIPPDSLKEDGILKQLNNVLISVESRAAK